MTRCGLLALPISLSKAPLGIKDKIELPGPMAARLPEIPVEYATRIMDRIGSDAAFVTSRAILELYSLPTEIIYLETFSPRSSARLISSASRISTVDAADTK